MHPILIGFSLALVPSSTALPQQEPLSETHRMVPAIRPGPTVASDVDKDGDIDLIHSYGRVFSSLNDGNGRLQVIGNSIAYDPAIGGLPYLGDFDGDGLEDVFLFGVDFGFRSNGDGTFAEVAISVPSTPAFPKFFRVSDVNGDGLADLWVLSGFGASLWVNMGGWVFVDDPSGLPALTNTVSEAITLDYDLDGDEDIFLGVGRFGIEIPNQLWRNDGALNFTSIDTALDDAAGASTLVIGLDYDADGDEDIYVYESRSSSSGNASTLFRNDGGGVFNNTSSILPNLGSSNTPISGASADLNGDGREDLVLSDNLSLTILLSSPGGFTIEVLNDGQSTTQSSYSALGIALFDIDGDGDQDVLLEKASDPAVLLLNDGAAQFRFSHGPSQATYPRSADLHLFDADLDGDMDAFITASIAGLPLTLLANDGAGQWEDASFDLPVVSPPGLTFSASTIADINQDGLEDILFAGTPLALLNMGNMIFEDAPQIFGATTVNGSAIEAADLDGDGDLDVMIGEAASLSGIRTFENDGTGILTQVGAVSGGQTRVLSLALADFDRDGDIDAILGSDSGTQETYLENMGGFVFTPIDNLFSSDAGETTEIVVFDANADGLLDVFFAREGSTSFGALDALYFGTGTGSFLDVSGNVQAPARSTRAAKAFDYDGDGNLDLVLLQALDTLAEEADSIRVLSNDGSGLFTDVQTLLGGPWIFQGALDVADVDFDGDIDVFTGNRLLINTTQHLAWRALPRLGKPLELEGRGPAGGSITLAASLNRAFLPVGALGIFQLDPATTFIVAVGTLDAQGRAIYGLNVPANNALLGLPIYWQALVGPPVRLTNLEPTVLTGF